MVGSASSTDSSFHIVCGNRVFCPSAQHDVAQSSVVLQQIEQCCGLKPDYYAASFPPSYDEQTLLVQVSQSKGNTAAPADAAYADAVYRTSVEEGARDLAVIEALLHSSQSASKTIRVIEISSKPSS